MSTEQYNIAGIDKHFRCQPNATTCFPTCCKILFDFYSQKWRVPQLGISLKRISRTCGYRERLGGVSVDDAVKGLNSLLTKHHISCEKLSGAGLGIKRVLVPYFEKQIALIVFLPISQFIENELGRDYSHAVIPTGLNFSESIDSIRIFDPLSGKVKDFDLGDFMAKWDTNKKTAVVFRRTEVDKVGNKLLYTR